MRLVQIGIIFYACFRISFQDEGVDISQKNFSERAAVSTIVGSKGGEFGEGTCKEVFKGRRC